MVTKAYIQEVISPTRVRVRIPLYHKIADVNGSVPNDLLPVAPIITPPNIKLDPKMGDVVIVSFEEDDLGKPVVIGFLCTDKDVRTGLNIVCEDLTGSGVIKLNDDILIGEIEYKNIVCLKDITIPLSDTFKTFTNSINKLKQDVGNNSTLIGENLSAIEDYKTTNNAALETLTGRVEDIERGLTDLQNTLNEYIKKNTPIIGQSAYGDNPNSVSNPSEGQLYFTVRQENN